MPITEGQQITFSFSFQEQDLKDFQRLSGDTNPLHSDPVFAQKCGFAKPVVYGGLLNAMISRALGTHLPGPGCIWHSLTIKYHKPLLVGQEAQLHGVVTY